MKYIVRTEGMVTSKRYRNQEIWAKDEEHAKMKAVEAFLRANSGKECKDVVVTSVEMDV